MDGRNRFHQQQRVPVHPAAALMEQRIIAQHREIQSLLLDNQRLAATHVALKQELSASTHELRHISAAATKLKAERDAQVRDVFERSLKMESEARMVVGVNEELIRVRGDMQKLNAERMELSSDLGAVRADLARLRADVHKLPLVKAEVEDLRRQIEIGRAAIELENKTREENLEQEEEMEKNMVIMARELKKLRAELANAKKKPWFRAVLMVMNMGLQQSHMPRMTERVCIDEFQNNSHELNQPLNFNKSRPHDTKLNCADGTQWQPKGDPNCMSTVKADQGLVVKGMAIEVQPKARPDHVSARENTYF
ncbi:hypothetical protein IFM89_012892 [Coptis chinensis]|uniref:Uncharacterized protein n=1 Tax=Coptis chinensis TaxID=261450 RepID=A0A835LIC6_9MAGN|nr:hypothetical protein IFM89_012892 [Coptis chinensis]